MSDRRRKRILLACFSCSPLWGSEPGVGWNWLRELSRLHDVTLVTHQFYRGHLEPELAQRPLEGVEIFYSGAWAAWRPPTTYLNSRLYYVWWQINLFFFVRRLVRIKQFDLIHHLTWGTVRFPSFLGFLGIPFVIGPIGGGDVAPRELLDGLPRKERTFEALRSLSLRLFKLDPITLKAASKAVVIFCKTDATRFCFPPQIRSKAELAFEIGTHPAPTIVQKKLRSTNSPFKLLFAGRLIGWKGVSIAISTVARLREIGVDATLDVAGDGPLRAHLTHQISQLNLDDRVTLLGALPRDELLARYGTADLFLFPSLHESSGNVVLEALSRSLPVMCLDLGGPKHYINEECGVIVSTKGLSRIEVEQSLTREIARLVQDPERLLRLSNAAQQHSCAQSWESRVVSAYARIGRQLSWQ